MPQDPKIVEHNIMLEKHGFPTERDDALSEPAQGIVRDERGQEQPADKKRAQQSTGAPQVSQTGQNSGYSSDEKKGK